jgi:hypothetical protein
LEEVVLEMTVADETEQLAWLVLQTANRTQAKGSSVRLVVPRAPEMTYELEPPLGEAQLLAVEEYLLERGYVTPVDIGLRWGTYTISPAGFDWLEGGLPEPTDRLGELAEKPGEEAAFESAVRAELEEERRRLEEVEWELEEVRQEPSGGTQSAEQGSREEPRPGGEEVQGDSERRSWWRRIFGG